ncbi:MAG: 50S ribosomal protein L9 [Bacteroidetes bacterium]|nr:MAG: 50S ribosomal protein L9 [Bacteroidota bacterium]
MKVILKQDIANLGFANDLIEVKSGYARNFLIPQGIAIQGTEQNIKILNEVLKQKSHKAEKIKNDAKAIAASLEAVSLKIGAKTGTSGKIFGSVNAMQIADALKEQANIEIDRKKIVVDGDNIKEVGEFIATVNLHREVKAEIKFEVVGE